MPRKLLDPIEISRTAWFAALGLLVAVLLWVYWPALDGAFVFDDRNNLLENPHFGAFSGQNLYWAFTHAHVGHYQPLTWVSFMGDHALWGMNPTGYHLTNILLHAANAVLFTLFSFMLLCRVGGRVAPDHKPTRVTFAAALMAGAVFALHPLRVESVAWITERRDVLCTVFFLAALIAYLKFTQAAAGRRSRWYLAAVAFFFLSLLSKALGMALPVVLLALDAWPLQRWRRVTCWPIWREKIPFMLLTLAAMLVAITAQSTAIVTLEAHPWPARIAQACYGLVFYLRATFFSVRWYPLYEIPFPLNPFEARFVLSAMLVCLVTAWLFWWRKRRPAGLVIWICYGALLGPVLGLAQSGNQLVADRYSYLACLGLALLVGWSFGRCWCALKPGGAGRVACAAAALVLLAGWSVLARQQTRIWHDEQVLWEHALDYGPSALAYNNLGVLQSRAGRPAEAVPLFADSLAVAPTYTMALDNLLPDLEAALDDLPEETLRRVAESLRGAMARHSSKGEGWYLLGVTMMKLKDFDRAAADLENACKVKPALAPAWYQLGMVMQMKGRNSDAIGLYRRAVEQDPDLGAAWLALGIGLIESGDLAGGKPVFAKATALLPENSLAWTGLGACLLQSGDRNGARTALERATALDPANQRAAAMLQGLRGTP